MDKPFLINAAKNLANSNQPAPSTYVSILEFLRIYAGEKSSFYKQVNNFKNSHEHNAALAKMILKGFITFLENGLTDGISIERKAQMDVVSDILEQANQLLDTKGVHSAAACVLIGASLEEFLRNWVEDKNLDLGNLKPGIDTYTKILKEAELITKQDFKDITSWAGLRNHAAHGEWDLVCDKSKISLMLQGVNLFLRKYST
ncbi:hypothetical protein IQ13_0232 [Lacibacter cauensis]|uniref:DUF4145 domain-containing protein n=1 Tax=Lacibacter cauensis TaxID=510947 RepID=A0A562SUT8_9BACT|nr:hypothetical protein [Lacibacter cauensis]TWI85077.1 hypothetical protein IQ13_0232 [Lacibacter cauensis]